MLSAAVAYATPIDDLAPASDVSATEVESMDSPQSSYSAIVDGRDKRQLGPLIGQLLGVGGYYPPGYAGGKIKRFLYFISKNWTIEKMMW